MLEKVIKRKGNKLYVKWKAYDTFNSWIDRKKICYIKMVFSHLTVIIKTNRSRIRFV